MVGLCVSGGPDCWRRCLAAAGHSPAQCHSMCGRPGMSRGKEPQTRGEWDLYFYICHLGFISDRQGERTYRRERKEDNAERDNKPGLPGLA